MTVGYEIHCLVDKNGERWWREWCTYVDAYTTKPTRDIELFKKTLLAREIAALEDSFHNRIDWRLERAAKRTKDEWDAEMNPLPEEEVLDPADQAGDESGGSVV